MAQTSVKEEPPHWSICLILHLGPWVLLVHTFLAITISPPHSLSETQKESIFGSWRPVCSAGMLGLVPYQRLALFGGYNITNPALTWPPFPGVTYSYFAVETRIHLGEAPLGGWKEQFCNCHCFSSPVANPPNPCAVRDNFRYKSLQELVDFVK